MIFWNGHASVPNAPKCNFIIKLKNWKICPETRYTRIAGAISAITLFRLNGRIEDLFLPENNGQKNTKITVH